MLCPSDRRATVSIETRCRRVVPDIKPYAVGGISCEFANSARDAGCRTFSLDELTLGAIMARHENLIGLALNEIPKQIGECGCMDNIVVLKWVVH